MTTKQPTPALTAFDQILARATPRRTTVTLYLAGDLAGQIQDLERSLADVGTWSPSSMADADPRREIAEQIADLQGQLRCSAADFRLQALPDEEWSDLLAAHPGRHAEEGFNPVTLSPALVAACCVDPVMTEDEYRGLCQVINHGQREDLEAAAWRVNNDTAVPFSLAASALLGTTAER
ncbi:hypothetical protein F4556_002358 [Kitasatospora gansuensis]|uniref:Uncharacterized protein n=1 Tax=Kitasatospora gansuensis TaxID=258050 RepID=A0A7W7SBJ2_9ACTN|nr:hypothetical protein [Kitasatospora gansuensis]MBB4946823.1 hypothetical protein [Kitasatospora gansuensis]